MNNIFGELRKYARKNHPILTYDGRELYKRIAENWTQYYSSRIDFSYSNRLEKLIAIAKAKTLRYIHEKDYDRKYNLYDIMLQLCPNNKGLAGVTTYVLELAIDINKKLNINKSEGYEKYEVTDADINKVVDGPVICADDYDEFIHSAIDFKKEELNELLIDRVLISFDSYISVYENAKKTNIVGKDLEYLNRMKIYKSKTIDLLEAPENFYWLCVDVNKRFEDGEQISTDLAWIFSQKEITNISLIIIN